MRAVLVNHHEVRKLVRALRGLIDQAFDPMDRFRHVVIATLYREGDKGLA